MRILIVDDDPKFRDYVCRGLGKFGMEATAAKDADAGIAALSSGAGFDMILLDVLMPGRSGWDFIETIRAGGDRTPVIFVTARHEVDERVRGLELGADDYVVKPFEFSELVARIKAVRRRRQESPVLELGDLRIDVGARTLERGGQRVELSSRQFDVLRALLEGEGQTLTRTELLRTVWGMDFDPGTNLVEVAIARLRRSLGGASQQWIETVVGEGYRFNRAGKRAP